MILSTGAFGSPAILMRSGVGPDAHLRSLDIPVLQDAPVGKGLKEHPFYYNVYALRKEASAMTPAAGAIIWTRSSEARAGELDLHISGTHIFDPAQSPTGGAIVLACAVTLPDSVGSVRLASRDPRAAPLIRYTRSSMLEVIRQDYVRTAQAKGLRERAVIYEHALRNALIPLVTVIALGLPRLLGGTVIIESIFAWPGMGTLAITAVRGRDYPVIMAINLITAVMILASNLLADVIYAVIDPRIKYS